MKKEPIVLVTAKFSEPSTASSSSTLNPASANAATLMSSKNTKRSKRSPERQKPTIPARKRSIRTWKWGASVSRHRCPPLPGPDAPLPRRDGRLLPLRRPLRPLRVLRAHERGGVRARRVQGRGGGGRRGLAELRGHQHDRFLLHPDGDRAGLR